MESVGKIFFRNNNCTKVTWFLNNHQIISYFETMWLFWHLRWLIKLKRWATTPWENHVWIHVGVEQLTLWQGGQQVLGAVVLECGNVAFSCGMRHHSKQKRDTQPRLWWNLKPGKILDIWQYNSWDVAYLDASATIQNFKDASDGVPNLKELSLNWISLCSRIQPCKHILIIGHSSTMVGPTFPNENRFQPLPNQGNALQAQKSCCGQPEFGAEKMARENLRVSWAQTCWVNFGSVAQRIPKKSPFLGPNHGE